MSAAEGSLGQSAAGSGSLALNLMKLRTFIALFAVLVFFSFAAASPLSPRIDSARGSSRSSRSPPI